MSYSVIDESNENVRTFDTRSIAEDKAAGVKQMVSDPSSIRVVQGAYDDYEDYQSNHDNADDAKTSREASIETLDAKADRKDTPVEPTETAVSDVQNKDISQDPLTVMPSHFVDEIQGVPTINRKGYAVLAEHYGISVTAEPVTLPSETDFEYAEFRAIATTENGTEYSGFGSAHVDRQDGDDPHLLAELAETRALKRAVSWATGVGMTAKTEMENSL
jgi:hypothetical protein